MDELLRTYRNIYQPVLFQPKSLFSQFLSFISTLRLKPDFIQYYSSGLASSRRYDDELAPSERLEVMNETVALSARSTTDFSGL